MSKSSFYRRLLPTIFAALILITIIFISTYWFLLRGTLTGSARNDFFGRAQIHALTAEEHLSKLGAISLQVASRSKIRENFYNYTLGNETLQNTRAFITPKLNDSLKSSNDFVGILWADHNFTTVSSVGLVEESLNFNMLYDHNEEIDVQFAGPVTIERKHYIRVTTHIRGPNNDIVGHNLVYYPIDSFQTLIKRRLNPSDDVLLMGFNERYYTVYDFNEGVSHDQIIQSALTDYRPDKLQQVGLETEYMSHAVAVIPIPGTLWYLTSTQSNTTLYSELNQLLSLVFWSILLLIFVTILLILRILKSAINEINRYHDELEITNESLMHSIRDLRNAQEQLVRRETLAALGELVGGLMHELNTPIGNALTSISFLDHEVRNLMENPKHDVAMYEEAYQISLSNLNKAITNIDIFRQINMDQATLEIRRLNLKAYIDEVILSLKPKLKKTKHTIEVQCDPNLIIITTPGILSQVLSNMILNSVIHGLEGIKQGRILIAIKVKENCLYINHSDNGIGIRPENIDHIFEPYFTTKRDNGGTGLGLHIIYTLVTQQLQGEVTVSSVPNSGTTFLITIPLNQA